MKTMTLGCESVLKCTLNMLATELFDYKSLKLSYILVHNIHKLISPMNLNKMEST